MGINPLDWHGRAADLEGIEADDGPGQKFLPDPRPGGQVDEAEQGDGQDGRPGEKRRPEGALFRPRIRHERPDYITRDFLPNFDIFLTTRPPRTSIMAPGGGTRTARGGAEEAGDERMS